MGERLHRIRRFRRSFPFQIHQQACPVLLRHEMGSSIRSAIYRNQQPEAELVCETGLEGDIHLDTWSYARLASMVRSGGDVVVCGRYDVRGNRVK